VSTPAAERGPFIVFEGGEGAGKSTQIHRLEAALHVAGHTVTLTREPGGSTIGQHVRRLLLDPNTGAIHPRTEALLFAADRAEHVATVIEPALAAGHAVISDRYMDSSAAYQGAGRGLQRDEIINLSMWAADGLVPDLTIILDIDPREGLARATKTEFGGADRIESEKIEFAYAVRQGFLDLAAANPERYVIVDATQSMLDISATIRDSVRARGINV
jgi:dTMP kinase